MSVLFSYNGTQADMARATLTHGHHDPTSTFTVIGLSQNDCAQVLGLQSSKSFVRDAASGSSTYIGLYFNVTYNPANGQVTGMVNGRSEHGQGVQTDASASGYLAVFTVGALALGTFTGSGFVLAAGALSGAALTTIDHAADMVSVFNDFNAGVAMMEDTQNPFNDASQTEINDFATMGNALLPDTRVDLGSGWSDTGTWGSQGYGGTDNGGYGNTDTYSQSSGSGPGGYFGQTIVVHDNVNNNAVVRHG